MANKKGKQVCKTVNGKKVCKPRLAVEGKKRTKTTPKKDVVVTKKGGIKEKQVMTPRKTKYKTKITKKKYKELYK